MIDDIIVWFENCQVLKSQDPDPCMILPYMRENGFEDIFLTMLAEMDIHVSGIRTEKDVNGRISAVFTKHMLGDGSFEELPFEEESSGTRKLFGLLPFMLEGLRSGSPVVADGMDANLHPRLLRYIIGLFTNPLSNPKGAQLIFTSHDISTMVPAVFRRDEIRFSAWNRTNASKLYSPAGFESDNMNENAYE